VRAGARLAIAVGAIGSAAALLAAGLAAGRTPAHETAAIRTVEVTMHFSRFEPSALSATPGETVRFVIRNTDPIDHEFILGDRRVQRVHELGTEAVHPPRPGEVSVPAGATVETTYTFGDAGALTFGCHVPGHYAYGMRGKVRIA
jgi:uncharacterized cupredoxin-like copper-binding protein